MSQTQAGLDESLTILDAIVYYEVHTGPPGADGSTNQALGTDRPAITFGAPEAGTVADSRRRRNSAEIVLPEPGAATYEAHSIWTAATGGTCKWVVPFDTNRTLLANDDLRIPVNGVSCQINPS